MAWSHIIPRLNHLSAAPGHWTIPGHLSVSAGPQELAEVAADLLTVLTPRSILFKPTPLVGFPIESVTATSGPADVRVTLTDDTELAGEHTYRLTVGSGGVNLQAGTRSGVSAGLATLAQVILAAHGAPWMGSFFTGAITRVTKGEAGELGRRRIPAASVTDGPAYGWRGVMLDVSRHFFPVRDVHALLDLYWLLRLSVFHWHLTDDQGWRLEIPGLPELTEYGAWRDDNTTKFGRYGGFYTNHQVESVIARAAARGLEVVPEIDVPGHGSAAITAYPDLSCRGVPPGVATRWGIFPDVLCVSNERSYQFMETVLSHVAAAFPSPYIHLGGDEAPPERWSQCESCRELMKREKMNRPEALHGYFVKRMVDVVHRLGRSVIVWDEVLELEPPEGTIIVAWRDVRYGTEAARRGYPVVMAPMTRACYLDHKHLNDSGETGRLGVCTVADSAGYDPAVAIAPEYRKHLLGGQAHVWTEGIGDRRQVEYMSLPRLSALAGTYWTGNPENWESAQPLLEAHRRLLGLYGLNTYAGPMRE